MIRAGTIPQAAIRRGIANLTVLSGQEFRSPHFSSNFHHFSSNIPHFCPQFGESPNREGPGYATGNKIPYAHCLVLWC